MRTLTAAALVMCAACAHPQARRAPGVIQIDIETSPTALDPRYATDAISERIVELMYQPMVRLDSQGGFTGDLAEEVDRISMSEIIFHLRRGVHFSDGRELTARDVKYTFDFVADRRNRSPKAAGLKQLKSIAVLDDYTIKMTTYGPYGAALEMAMLGIVPNGAPARAKGLDAPPGSGPFKLRELERDDRIVLERSYSTPANAIQEIVFKVVPDPTVRALELVEGICDLAPNNIQADLLPYLRAQSGLEVVTAPGTTYWYLTFNFRDPALHDSRVRRAIAYAIDREEIIRSYLRGTARAATGLLTPENWAYSGEVTRYPYDPRRARALLEEAGFNDRHQLTLVYKCAPDGMRMGEIMQAMLRRVGIGVTIRSNEWATFYYDMQRGNFDIAAMPWIGIRDPHHYSMVFDSLMTPPHGLNRGHYSNPKMDRLVEAGDATIDEAARKQVYRQVQRLAADDLPYVSLWWQDNVVVMSRALAAFRPRPNGSLLPLADLTLVP